MTIFPSTSTKLPAKLLEPNPEVYLSDNYIVIDFETTNKSRGSALDGSNRLILACAKLGSGHPDYSTYPSGYSHWGSEFEQSGLLRLIQQADVIVGHNLKFEYQWLVRCGYELGSALGFDTYLAEYCIAGNRRWKLGLDECCERHGIVGKRSFVAALIGGGVCPSDIPSDALEAYCQQDVRSTEQLFLSQRRRLVQLGLLPVVYQRCLVTPVLSDIERNGMCLSADIVKDKHGEYITKFNQATGRFAQIAGGRNPRSSKQMGEFLYGDPAAGNLGFQEILDRHGIPDRTTGGRPRTDGPTIAQLDAATAAQRTFKEACVELSKLKVPVQNLKKMMDILAKGEQIVKAKFNQAVTQTHRLSSSGVGDYGFQFHNFDRAFKPCFRSRGAGYVVVEADAPQLEFRVAGELGHDEAVSRSVTNGEDVHAFTASILGTTRQKAKAHTFKPLYGGQSGTDKEKKYYKAFRKKYAQLYKEQTKWTMTVAGNKDGKLVTASGLVFYWPGTKIRESGYVENTPSIFNYPVQSFATAEIIPLCLVMIWHRMNAEGIDGFIVNTIHDSVIAEIAEKDLDKYKQIVVDCFTQDIYTVLKSLYGIEFKTPLGVAIKHDTHWGQGKEELYERH